MRVDYTYYVFTINPSNHTTDNKGYVHREWDYETPVLTTLEVMWITSIHKQNQTHREKKQRVGGAANSMTITLSAHYTWFTEKYSTTGSTFWNIWATLQFSLHAGPLIDMQKASHTWVRHVKQLILWKRPFKRVFWSLGLPVVMKRLVSSHVSFAQVASFPAHQIINTNRDRLIETKRGWQRSEIRWRSRERANKEKWKMWKNMYKFSPPLIGLNISIYILEYSFTLR